MNKIMDKDRETRLLNRSWIFIIPGLMVLTVGIVITFVFLFTDDVPHPKHPDEYSVIPSNSTLNVEFINVTLEPGWYEIWYDEYSHPGNISISIENMVQYEKLVPDPDNDFWIKRNFTTYHRLTAFRISEGSNVTITKTNDDRFYLTTVLYKPVDLRLMWNGIIVVTIGVVIMSPGLVMVFIASKNNGPTARENMKKEIDTLKAVEIDLKRSKQFWGMVLFFIIGPILFAFALALPLYLAFEWYQCLKVPLITVGVIAALLGFKMFYNKQMLGPGGELSFKTVYDTNPSGSHIYGSGDNARVHRKKMRMKEAQKVYNKYFRLFKKGRISKEDLKNALHPYRYDLRDLGYPIKIPQEEELITYQIEEGDCNER